MGARICPLKKSGEKGGSRESSQSKNGVRKMTGGRGLGKGEVSLRHSQAASLGRRNPKTGFGKESRTNSKNRGGGKNRKSQ